MHQYDHDWTQPYPRQKDWRKQAACRNSDTTKYIPLPKEQRTKAVRYDRTTCYACPVIKDCLDYTLANRPPIGLWAGTLPEDRNKMYPKYQGEREHDFDVNYLISDHTNSNSSASIYDETSCTINGNLCDILADDSTYNRCRRQIDPFSDIIH